MKTGNTRHTAAGGVEPGRASMEPGHEDREYIYGAGYLLTSVDASMEPGHEDREYHRSVCEMYLR